MRRAALVAAGGSGAAGGSASGSGDLNQSRNEGRFGSVGGSGTGGRSAGCAGEDTGSPTAVPQDPGCGRGGNSDSGGFEAVAAGGRGGAATRPGRRTMRSRSTRAGQRAAPVTTPVPASARAPSARARVPGRLALQRRLALRRRPGRQRGLGCGSRSGRGRGPGQRGERTADPEAAPFTELAGAGVPAPRTPIIRTARRARSARVVPADHPDRIRGDLRSAGITEVVCHRIVTVRTYRHVPFRSPPYRRIRPFTPTDYASAVISPGEIR